ncbi:DNA polymerase/3'-5' exonuclease PolX [Candidatus Solirubrobacter pratensis]|uniref:DNA polymerase/3'-5' exonuclease PolX n=1 Tax=Candidatus Solirubrobacter pratensis TaxID=1298857 RepID=UPI0004282B6E|nr:DNA polymerase/3'-5' exonuclease PolX [Candidatus Solirubrobacter pratensis]
MSTKTNAEIAAAFDELGDLYELDGAVSYRVIAYRTAAKAVRDASVSVMALTRDGRVTELPGIGKTLEEKLHALDETGDIPAAQKLRAKFPAGLIAVMHLPGFGPKRARLLYDELQVDSLEKLREAAEAGQIRTLRGFGAKVEENLLRVLADHDEGGSPAPRILLSRALPVAEQIAGALRDHPAADRVEIAGSLRRLGDTAKDIDIIATASDPAALIDRLRELELVESVHASGDAGARVVTHSGMKVDLKVVAPDQFGNVLQHFTGGKAHNVQLREWAVRRGLHISEYGVLDDETGETTRCATEEGVYERLGLPWIAPELREGRGELEAALKGELPRLVELSDIRGDLHCHTTLSDGRQTAEQMAEAALARGYEYLAITDHSASHGFGDHVTAEALEQRIEEIAALNASLDAIQLLAGTEVNILPDGSLDYPDELLARLDWVIASVHTSFGMDEATMTDRMIRAIEHPYVDAIGHPTGRKIETRPPYAIDMTRVIAAAARTGTMIEINAAPDRRDMNEIHARAAAAAGVKVLIDSDAHSARNFELLRYGIATARRAWLTPEQVANTRPWPEFAALRKRSKGAQ